MREALVTGSAGFLGRHFTEALWDAGWQVTCCDTADGESPADCMNIFRVPGRTYDLVVHAAAAGPNLATATTRPAVMAHNAMVDAAMFDWAVRTGQGRVLYLSSCAAYPARLQHPTGPGRLLTESDAPTPRGGLRSAEPPTDAYGWWKLDGERMAAAAEGEGLAVTVVRPFSGYGTGQSEDHPFGAFTGRARRREDPFTVWGGGGQVRDMVHADDVAGAALALAAAGARGPVNICTGVATTVAALARMVCDAAGYTPEFRFDAAMPAGAPWRVGDPTLLREVYTPKIDLAEGVRRAVAGGR